MKHTSQRGEASSSVVSALALIVIAGVAVFFYFRAQAADEARKRAEAMEVQAKRDDVMKKVSEGIEKDKATIERNSK